MSDEQEKHLKQLAKEGKKKENEVVSSTPYVEVPSSSHVVFEAAVWYRKFAKLSLYSFLGVAAASIFLSLALAYVMTRPPETLSYLMDSEGRIVKLEPVRNPSMSDAEVLSWGSDMVFKIHNISFANYMEHIMSLQHYFTAEAFRNYQAALRESKTIEKITNERLVMWIEPTKAPRIVSAKTIGGKFTWVIEFDLVQYMGGGGYTANGNPLVATMVVERTSHTTNLAGVVISKYLVKEK